ncbi:hypothetical protein CJF31_00011323 [Rutstroemia sp. NJR-2017a BVV2]|nr:hypothetical protein CJF31_00011323 [Rutstroemia sp. NJR-2017a BVV2]
MGSCLYTNKQIPGFFMAIYRDMEEQIHIHFKLQVFVKLAGKKKQIDILLVVPPDADFANASIPCPISSIDLSHDASALHEAGLTNAQNVFLIRFNLTTKGFVVTKNKTTTIRPHSTTTNMLIRGLESLSNATIFNVYIRPSTYAKVHLEKLGIHFSNPTTDIRKTDLREMYIQQGAILLEWNKFVYQELHPVQVPRSPPPYAQLSPKAQVPRSPPLYAQLSPKAQVPRSPPLCAQPSPEVQVPRSPPLYAQPSPEAQISQSSLIIFEEAIEETPARSPISSNSISVHGIFSGCEESSESSDSEVNLDDIERDNGIDFEINSDEEELANLNSPELNQQFDYDAKVSQMLNSKLEKWIETVLPINLKLHYHTRLTTKLSILGNCIHISNIKMFDITLLWCSTLFFYDPLDSDSDNTLGLWEKRNSWLIRDMAEMIQWADEIRHSTEINSSVLEHLMKLGHAARTVALDPRYDRGVYLKQKSVFMTYILREFRKPGSIGNSKPVSRKSLGIDSNAPKRVKI